jgi:hypothetical protein
MYSNRRSRRAEAAKRDLDRAAAHRDHERATTLLNQLETLNAGEPRWPHRQGDLHRAAGRAHEAVAADLRASDRYADRGFAERAVAVRRLANTLAEQGVPPLPTHATIGSTHIRQKVRRRVEPRQPLAPVSDELYG